MNVIFCPPSVFGVCANVRAFPVIFPVGPAWTLRLVDNAVLLPNIVVELSDIVTPPAVALVNVVPTTKLLKLIVLVHVGADVGLAEGLTLGVDVVGVEVVGDVQGLEVVGDSLGLTDGLDVGVSVGVDVVGDTEGVEYVGDSLGLTDGLNVGVSVGVDVVGDTDGLDVGVSVGVDVVGDTDGLDVVGDTDGLAEGLSLGVEVVGVEVEGDVLGLEVVGDSLGVEVVGVTVVGDVLGVDVVGLKVGLEVVGDDDVRHGPISSQACAHAPPYVVEKGSNPTWLHSLSRVGIAAVDLHFKICPFLDTKLPATYAVPTTHSLGQPAIGPTATDVVVEIAVEGAMVPEHGPIS